MPPTLDSAARLGTFATLGALGVTQELAQVCLQSMEGADPELVAEESLCLVATATARALEVGLAAQPELAAAAGSSALKLPFTYHEYLIGGAMIAQSDPNLADANRGIAGRLTRKMDFYQIHLPSGQFPGERMLKEKMSLWMGRISPPGLHDLPDDRLTRLDLVSTVATHLRLVLSFARRESESPDG